MRGERERARLRDREPGRRGLLDLRAVGAVGVPGAARRVDELEQDQRGELRPDAHAAVCAPAAPPLPPPLSTPAEEAIDWTTISIAPALPPGAPFAPAAPLPPGPPSDRRRPPSVSGPCAT